MLSLEDPSCVVRDIFVLITKITVIIIRTTSLSYMCVGRRKIYICVYIYSINLIQINTYADNNIFVFVYEDKKF